MFLVFSVLSLFTFSLFITTIYLLLLQYMRFFKHTKLSAELTLNLNFYILLFYLLCFSLSLICIIQEYSCKLTGQALAHAIMHEMFIPTTEFRKIIWTCQKYLLQAMKVFLIKLALLDQIILITGFSKEKFNKLSLYIFI